MSYFSARVLFPRSGAILESFTFSLTSLSTKSRLLGLMDAARLLLSGNRVEFEDVSARNARFIVLLIGDGGSLIAPIMGDVRW